MNFFGDKRIWYVAAAVIVVIILAVVLWPRRVTMPSPAPATTSAPATTPTAPKPANQ